MFRWDIVSVDKTNNVNTCDGTSIINSTWANIGQPFSVIKNQQEIIESIPNVNNFLIELNDFDWHKTTYIDLWHSMNGKKTKGSTRFYLILSTSVDINR